MIRTNNLLLNGNGYDKFIYPLQEINENLKSKVIITL